MSGFLRSIFGGGSAKERGGRLSRSQVFDEEVSKLNYDETLLLTRYLMTLARRRRCATNHLGGDIPNERGLDGMLGGWYYQNGYTDADALDVMAADLEAITQNATQTSEVVNRRVLWTDYFSNGEQLEDYYSYGKINPFTFGSHGGPISLRDTLFDRMGFPGRVSTIISFDPEIKGHRHQIRYFRALLTAYSLAHILGSSGREKDLADIWRQTSAPWLTDGWPLFDEWTIFPSDRKNYRRMRIFYMIPARLVSRRRCLTCTVVILKTY